MHKKYNSFIFAIAMCIISLSSIPVLAANTCDYTDSTVNPQKIAGTLSNNSNAENTLVYELTNIKMNGDVLELYGWAFEPWKDTYLNGGSGTKDGSVEFYFYPEDNPSGEKVYFKKEGIVYATESSGGCPTTGCSDGSPKYFDYTYWQCYKGGSKGQDKWCSDMGGDGSGNKWGRLTPDLKGGFKASFNLKEAYESGEMKKGIDYILHMVFKKGSGYTKEIDASIHKGLVHESVDKYQGYDTESDGKFSIDITGFKSTASVIATAGIPSGSNGFPCSSQWKDYSAYYFQTTDGYNVDLEVKHSCRGKVGETCTSGTTGPGAINIYGLSVKPTLTKIGGKLRATPGTGATGYTPASWITFDGNIKISTKEREGEDPGICEGDEIYYLYYYMMDGVNEKFKGNISYNAIYQDAKVLTELDFKTNGDISDKVGGPLSYKTVRSNLSTYYNNFWAAIENGGVYEQDKKYYLVPEQFYKWINSRKQNFPLSEFQLHKGYDKGTLVAHKQDSFTMNPNGNLGFQFNIHEIVDYSEEKNSPLSILSGGNANSFGKDSLYKHFTVYQLTVCKSDIKKAQCEDTVEQAVCDENGTHAVFHEHKDIKNCTLPKGNNSGFNIVDSQFGQVACKEDLDFYLPGSKETAAGQYFVLNSYIPKVEARRTCATSPVSYTKFDQILKDIEKPMPKTYNQYRDSLFIYNQITEVKQLPETTRSCTGKDPEMENGKPKVDAQGNIIYKSETIHVTPLEIWVNNPTGPNYGQTGIRFNNPEKSEYIPDADLCKDPPKSETPDDFFDRIKSEWEEKTRRFKDSYDGALEDYHNTILEYNKMFSWTETVVDTVYHRVTDLQNASYISTTNGYVDTKYTFKPDVKFTYQDKDSAVFNPTPYQYDGKSPSEQKDYWGMDAEPDNYYTSGGAGILHDRRPLINCVNGGNTCYDTTTIDGDFYHNGAIRRDEDIEYEYNLPRVVTTIPDGRVYLQGKNTTNKTEILLEEEAVPVNINTPSGTYNYSITFEKFKDELRKSMYSSNQDDNWADEPPGKGETRLVQRNVLNTGDMYVCTYRVINDIYLPNEEKFNFFYRVVDTYNINPLGRTLGYNWVDERAEKVKEVIKEDAVSVTTLKEEHDKFVYTLDPVTMQEIRKYNAKQDEGYSDWDLVCSDYDNTGVRKGYHCYSHFLSCLVGGDGNGTGLNCSEVVGTYRNNGGYGVDELNQNRDLLIRKQNALDGKGES